MQRWQGRARVLSSDLGGLSFGQDDDGNWGYKAGGADTVVPFKNGQAIKVTVEGKGDIAGAWTVDLGVNGTVERLRRHLLGEH